MRYLSEVNFESEVGLINSREHSFFADYVGLFYLDKNKAHFQQ